MTIMTCVIVCKKPDSTANTQLFDSSLAPTDMNIDP